jgi:hypothetical protein
MAPNSGTERWFFVHIVGVVLTGAPADRIQMCEGHSPSSGSMAHRRARLARRTVSHRCHRRSRVRRHSCRPVLQSERTAGRRSRLDLHHCAAQGFQRVARHRLVLGEAVREANPATDWSRRCLAPRTGGFGPRRAEPWLRCAATPESCRTAKRRVDRRRGCRTKGQGDSVPVAPSRGEVRGDPAILLNRQATSGKRGGWR